MSGLNRLSFALGRAARFARAWLCLSVAAVCGCRAGGVPVLNVLGLDKPLVVALVAEPPAPNIKSVLTNPFDPYEPLRTELADHLDRPVAVDLCLPVQLEANLDLGFYHLAIVSPTQYAAIAKRERFEVLAATSGARGAVLITRSDAPIQNIRELRGKTVAFGQAGDLRTHLSGLALLKEHGLSSLDLSLELLPIPGSLRHVGAPAEIAAQVARGDAAAGFVDERWWAALPPRASADELAQDRFRILGRTASLPDRMMIASKRLDNETAARIRRWLLSNRPAEENAFARLGWAGMDAPESGLTAACAGLSEFVPSTMLVAR